MEDAVGAGGGQVSGPGHEFLACRLDNLQRVALIECSIRLRGDEANDGEEGAWIMSQAQVATGRAKRSIQIALKQLLSERVEQGGSEQTTAQAEGGWQVCGSLWLTQFLAEGVDVHGGGKKQRQRLDILDLGKHDTCCGGKEQTVRGLDEGRAVSIVDLLHHVGSSHRDDGTDAASARPARDERV